MIHGVFRLMRGLEKSEHEEVLIECMEEEYIEPNDENITTEY